MLGELLVRRVLGAVKGRGPAAAGVVLLVVCAGVTVDIVLSRALETAVHHVVTGCSETEATMSARASSVFNALVDRLGPPSREAANGNDLAWDSAAVGDGGAVRLEVALWDSGDPCTWDLNLSVHVADIGNGPDADRLVRALDDREIGRRFELSGSFIHRADGSLFISKRSRLRETHPQSLFWLDDTVDLAAVWRGPWLAQVREVAEGRAPKPANHVWREGRDPDSVIRRAREFLREAGVGD